MNNWKRFSRRDCPICNGARNDCRASLSTGLILAQITLTEAHRKALQARGLTKADIEAGMYRSVVPWQKLNHPVSDRLARLQNKEGEP